MRLLYHLPLDAACRRVRLVLGEKKLEVELRVERVWQRRAAFLHLNPAGEVPVLVEPDGTSIVGAEVAGEYLDEVFADPPLLGATPIDRAETRRLIDWYGRKFHAEVTANLVGEKVMKRLTGRGQPDTAAIRKGHANLRYHLDYVAWLMERRRWLAGDDFSLADITAAAELSALDYLGDVPWAEHPEAKDWYARIKSRPCFRTLLADTVAGIAPPKHYADLDF